MTLLLTSLFLLGLGSAKKCGNTCRDLEASEVYLKNYDKATYASYLPKRPEFEKIDNICYTVYLLPDKPSTAIVYQSEVYKDGTSAVISLLSQQIAPGVLKVAAPMGTSKRTIINADCDQTIFNTCTEFGGPESYVYAVSPSKEQISVECFESALKVHASQGLLADKDKYFRLPNKLPTQCV